MNNFINDIGGNPIVKLFVIALLLDIFLGSIRAIKEKSWNSTVGINGMLRKAGMIVTILFLGLADGVMNFNMLSFVSQDILNAISLQKVGLCEFFGIMFILYEATSCLKNMAIIDIPISKPLNKKLQEWLKKMTSELDNQKS